MEGAGPREARFPTTGPDRLRYRVRCSKMGQIWVSHSRMRRKVAAPTNALHLGMKHQQSMTMTVRGSLAQSALRYRLVADPGEALGLSEHRQHLEYVR